MTGLSCTLKLVSLIQQQQRQRQESHSFKLLFICKGNFDEEQIIIYPRLHAIHPNNIALAVSVFLKTAVKRFTEKQEKLPSTTQHNHSIIVPVVF